MTNEILNVILSFVSGLIVSVIVMVIVGIKYEIKRIAQKVEDIDALQESSQNFNLDFIREIEQIREKNSRDIDEMYRYVDSRTDKLENKLVDTIKNGCEPVKSK